MDDENDALAGGEDLTIDQAAERYAAATSNAVSNDPAEDEAPDDGETTDELDASEEGESEDEGEPGADDQAEDEDEQPESDQGRFVADNAKVRLEDGTIVSIADLKKGSLLNADYTRKTQEVAEQRRSVESQSAQLKQLETQLSEQRQYVAQLVQSIMPQAPDPSRADPRSPNYDPVGYMADRTAHEQFMGHLQFLEQQNQQTRQQSEAEMQAQRLEKSNAEYAALIEKVPAFKDQARLTGFVNDVRDHGGAYGFSPQELAEGIGYDHRMAMVMRDAIQWRKLQASKPKVQSKVEGRPPIQKGGKRLSPDGQRARAQSVAMERLKTSGSVNDAVAAYLASQKG